MSVLRFCWLIEKKTFSVLSNFSGSAILVISGDKAGVSFYLGTRDTNRPDVAKEES